MRATREASGWNADDPIPSSADAERIAGYDDAWDMSTRPTRVKATPTVSE